MLLVALLATDAVGYAPMPPHDYQPGFERTGVIPPAGARGAGSAGSRVIALASGALAVDADSGELVLADANGARVAWIDIGVGAGLAVYDPASQRAYVANRARDRIEVIAVRADSLQLVETIATPAEPYGVALAGNTLLVTAIADRAVIAYNVAGHELWRAAVAAEPRAVAIAPDGKHALVTHTTEGAVEVIDLATHKLASRTLRDDLGPQCTQFQSDPKSSLQCADPGGTGFARGAYAATFVGSSLAAVAFQRETPVPRPEFAQEGTYGGRAIPITRHVGFVGLGGTQAVAQVGVADPRALAYDAARDILYVAGMGDDRLLLVEHASHEDAAFGDAVSLRDRSACGADGLAVAPDGSVLAWCSFTRSIAHVHFEQAPAKSIPRYTADITRGPALAPTRLSETAHAGLVRYYSAGEEVSRHGRQTCATCHLDGKSDGLAWAIDKHALRTPVLAGRVAGTAPYKWSGRDRDLEHSIIATIARLGGRDAEPDPIAAFLEAMPRPRAPTLPADAVARGKALFASTELGCDGCHGGAELTDHQRHTFAGAPFELDTPSLRAAAAAPRSLHDGSAATLDDVLAERGSIKGMIARPLSASERADLAAYLRSL